MNSTDYFHFDIEEDTSDIWSRNLFDEFLKANHLIFNALDIRLVYPNFVISRELPRAWGLWEKSTRTIYIARNLLNNFPWSAVVETLKHEMAHMIDDEIFTQNAGYSTEGRDPHGAGFERACTILGIDAKASTTYMEKIRGELPERERLKGKVYKLLALGDSCHKAEAEAAVAKAHSIMAKYNITLQKNNDEKIYLRRPVGIKWKKVPTYIMTLVNLVGRYYCINHIRCGGRRGGQYYEFFGQPHNLDIAEYIFNFLLNEGERQWEQFKESDEYKKFYRERREEKMQGIIYSSNWRNRYTKTAFIDGLYNGFASTLKKNEDRIIEEIGKENVLPIAANDGMLKKEFDKQYPNTRTLHSNGYNCSGGYSSGYSRGKNISIKSGVVGGSRGILLNA